MKYRREMKGKAVGMGWSRIQREREREGAEETITVNKSLKRSRQHHQHPGRPPVRDIKATREALEKEPSTGTRRCRTPLDRPSKAIMQRHLKSLDSLQKYPSLVNLKPTLLQNDNARPHTAKVTREKIEELGGIELPPRTVFSPDLVPSDF
ncbi:Histone-lysine N-methyltransferase SETMAR [Eumeta japonica]|uniref:Histone-lysine N-methyltransferase SETMAR n=1 Tax=Eumeta variegata TaxID=151549 RepID=A0A4C1TUJ4_EUMVA|nr:Histone-lysine N-methyltransferase SETMAR [Eumeta japonica]